MNVAICKTMLRLPETQSLKGKRRIISSLCGRIRNKFNVSVAEVDNNDLWQTATLGFSCVSNQRGHAEKTISRIIDFIETTRSDVDMVDVERETLMGF